MVGSSTEPRESLLAPASIYRTSGLPLERSAFNRIAGTRPDRHVERPATHSAARGQRERPATHSMPKVSDSRPAFQAGFALAARGRIGRFDRTPVRPQDSCCQSAVRANGRATRKTAPVASSGSAPLRPNTGRDERQVPRRPLKTRPCAREGKSNNHRAFTYNHCVPCGTRQLHASPAATRHAYEPALLPDERLRQLPRRRSDHRDGQLPHLRVRPPAPLTRTAAPTRVRRSRSARRRSRTRSPSYR